MDTLIRAAKLGKQPVLLRRGEDALHENLPADEPVGGHSASRGIVPDLGSHAAPLAGMAAGQMASVDRAVTSARSDPLASEPPPAPVNGAPTEPRTASYEEYEQRLGSELERMRQSAREEGCAQGLEQGLVKGLEQAREQVQAEFAGELKHLRGLMQSARAALEQQVEGLLDVGAEIVYEAVTRIIGRALLDHQGVTAVVREVIRQAKDRSRLVVRVHPDDQPVLAACAEELVAGLNVGQIEVLGDDRVVLGGCLLETPAGNLDGRLEIQLQQLRDALLSGRARHADAAGDA